MFTGTVDQALETLRTSARSDIMNFTEFMGAHPNTVNGWLLGTSPPMGDNKIRIISYFVLNGWKIDEYEQRDPLAQKLMLLLGYKVISMKEMLEELALSPSNAQGVLAFLYGEREFSKPTRRLAEMLVAQKASQLSDVAQKLATNYVIKESDDTTRSVERVEGDDVVSRLSALLQQVMPMAELLNSDQFTDADRANMRLLVGPEVYEKLCVTLNLMKSRQNRTEQLGATRVAPLSIRQPGR